nr:glycine-rich RNA-binding protein 2, mitochondrial-like [Tanacetum cinerariifolium]
MAFYSKIGSLMRQNVSQTVVSNGQPSMFNAIRCMSSKLFVGARVIIDRESGRSRGFGFVNYDADESANVAMKAMDGQELNGRSIRVSLATERGGGGGGYNRNFNDAGNDRSIMNSVCIV